MSALPTELLISEGARTLLVPLALGGAAALLVYLSWTGAQGESLAGDSVPSWYANAAGDPRAALLTARDAVRDAQQRVERANAAIRDLTGVLVSARRRGRRDMQPVHDLKAVAIQARSEMDAAAGSLQTARDLAAGARELAAGARRPDNVLRGLAAVERGVRRAVLDFRTAGENLADAEQALPAMTAAAPTAVTDEARQVMDDALRQVTVATRRTESLPDVLSVASIALELAARPEFPKLRWLFQWLPKRLRRLFGRVTALGPIDYLGGWLASLRQAYGDAVAFAVVVVLILIFGLIGLNLLGAEPLILGLTAGALLATALALALRRRHMGAALVAAAVVPAVGIVGLWTALTLPYSVYAVGLTLLTVWLTAGAMFRWSSPKAVAWILFAAIAFWSGALGFLRERGDRDPTLEVAFVKSSSSGDAFKGFFLGRTSDHVYLASTRRCHEDGCRRVLSIQDDEATCLALGRPKEVPRHERDVIPTVTPELAAFRGESGDVCEPEPPRKGDRPQQPSPRSVRRSERSLALDFDLDIFPRRSVYIRRPRRDVSLDFDFDASPWLPLFSQPSRTRTRFALVSDVLFRFGDDRLTLGARRRLRGVVRWIRRARPRLVYVYGHADEKGTPVANWELSNRRARAVRRALVRRHAVDRSQVVIRGFGETWPAVCGRGRGGFDDPASRVYNRRVEIYTQEPPATAPTRCPG